MEEVVVRPKPRNPRRMLAGGCALLLLASAGLLWLAAGSPRGRSVRLADGSILTLETVTFGARTVVLGSPWQRALHWVLPDRMKHLSGCEAYQAEPGTLTFWVHRRGNPVNSWPLQAAALDEHGCLSATGSSQGLGNNLERYEFRAFPRRGREVGLRLYRTSGATSTPLGELRVPNPNPGPHPTWAPRPLPQTARAGDLQVTLSELAADVPEPEGFSFGRFPGQVYCAAGLRITRGGKPARDWSPGIASISDATGNTWQSGSSGYRGGDPVLRLLFAGNPWPDEDAWKVRVRLSRTSQAKFSPAELWPVTGVPIPPPGRQIRVGKRAVIHGVPLEVEAVYGAGVQVPDLSFGDSRPRVLVRVRGVFPDDLSRTLVKLTDERGRKVEVATTVSTGDSNGLKELLSLELPAGARTVNLIWALHKSRYVEFTAPVARPRR